MTQQDLDILSAHYRERLATARQAGVRPAVQDVRLDLAARLIREARAAAPDPGDPAILALALTAIGPLDDGPLPLDVLNDAQRHVTPPSPPWHETATPRSDPAVDAAVWYGLGGSGRAVGYDGWAAHWEVAGAWLRAEVSDACAEVDRTLKEWVRRDVKDHLDDGDSGGRRRASPAIGIGAPDLIAARLVRRAPTTYEIGPSRPLELEFVPAPVREGPAPDDVEDDYRDAFEGPRLVVTAGGECVARHAEMRYVFQSSEPLEGARVRVEAGNWTIVRVGDTQAVVENRPGKEGGPKLTRSQPRISLVPARAAVMTESLCQCGTLNCRTTHTLSAWSPAQAAGVSLSNFVWNAVKGPRALYKPNAAADGQVVPLALHSFKTSMYYAALVSGAATPDGFPRLRAAQVALFVCECEARAMVATEMRHSACATPLVRVTADGRLIAVDVSNYTLRAYWKARAHHRSGGEVYLTQRSDATSSRPTFLWTREA
jgi:hypothetical protein